MVAAQLRDPPNFISQQLVPGELEPSQPFSPAHKSSVPLAAHLESTREQKPLRHVSPLTGVWERVCGAQASLLFQSFHYFPLIQKCKFQW